MLTLGDFEQGEGLTPAEQMLRDAAAGGEVAVIQDGRLPDAADESRERIVRAEFLIYLALGGCERLRPTYRGIRLQGARVTGFINLEDAVLPFQLGLYDCHFEQSIVLQNAETTLLNLQGSRLAGVDSGGYALVADGLKVTRDCFLRYISTTGGLSLLGAEIGGKLVASGLRVEIEQVEGDPEATGRQAWALSLLDAKVGVDVFLDNVMLIGGLDFTSAEVNGSIFISQSLIMRAMGSSVRGSGAKIRDNLRIAEGANFAGGIELTRTKITGNLVIADARIAAGGGEGPALVLDSATISGAFFMRDAPQRRPDENPKGPKPKMFDGLVDLTDLDLGTLVDARDCWPDRGKLFLDGFQYARIGGDERTPIDFPARKDWLLRQPSKYIGDNFRAQPFEQLMSVYRAIGHTDDHRRVGVLKQQQMRRAGRIPWWMLPFHRLFGAVTGYGFWTSRAMLWAVLIVGLGAWLYDTAWRAGAMAPSVEVLVQDASWRSCAERSANPAECWVRSGAGRDYETFDPIIYSLDLFLPIVDLEQEIAWSPTTQRGASLADVLPPAALARAPWAAEAADQITVGRIAWFWKFIHEALGYILSAFVIAGAANLVRAS